MKKIIILLLFTLGLFPVFSLEITDFSIISKNKKIVITESKEQILNSFEKENIKKKELNNSCENYITDDIDITFLGDKVISIIIQNKKYYLSSKIKIGDKISKVNKKFGDPNYKGKSSDSSYFMDYYLRIETDSPWKEPQYTLRFIYLNNKITKIAIFYTE